MKRILIIKNVFLFFLPNVFYLLSWQNYFIEKVTFQN